MKLRYHLWHLFAATAAAASAIWLWTLYPNYIWLVAWCLAEMGVLWWLSGKEGW